MASDNEFRSSLVWAEKIVRDRQNNAKTKVETTSKLKIALYILVSAVVILTLLYIIYRAYRTPDPLSILAEVNKMINQSEPSDIGEYSG